MAGIPKKALRDDDKLIKIKRIDDGSHETWYVSFIDEAGENQVIRHGYYKKLDATKNFPELLAKISVATGAIKSSFQGSRSASEYLVFDEHDNITGIVSLNLEGFKALNFSHEGIPTDPTEKELVIPGTETLIAKDMMALLFGRWFLGDDDGHPHNLSLAGDIDYDMFFYWFVIFMKGPRSGVTYPKTRPDLTVRDYERFPCVIDAAPYHWPPFTHPGQESIILALPEMVQKPILSATLPSILPKVYKDPKQFIGLAASPEAHEQKFAAALRVLVTFQPKVMRRKFTDLFGSLTLNFTSLSQEKRDKYREVFPDLCNDITNAELFVDFMMKMYQQHYDNLCRVVVFYMGCKNNDFGVPLPATNDALYRKPSFYKDIVAWVKEENATTYAHEPENQFNLDELKKRYHKVWRDSFALRLKEMLRSSRKLTEQISILAKKGKIEELISKSTTDNSLTEAWELFGPLKDLTIAEDISVKEKDSQPKKEELKPQKDESQPKQKGVEDALESLINFTNEFQHLIKSYYYEKKNIDDLTDYDSQFFAGGLTALWSKYEAKIKEYLVYTTSHANQFGSIIRELKQFADQVNFKLHLLSTDEQMKEAQITFKKELLPLTHPEIITQFNETLFNWVDSLSLEKFNSYIIEIIDQKYAPPSSLAFISARQRAVPVKDYISKSKEANHNKLAYIFSSGSKEDGALNTCIIRALTRLMLQTNYVSSVTHATNEEFEQQIGNFVKAAVIFAKEDKDMVHLYSPQGIQLFYETLYDWVEKQGNQNKQQQKRLDPLINQALKTYENGLSAFAGLAFWSSAPSSRKIEIKKYFRNSENYAQSLALTFLKGDLTSTASECILRDLIKAIKEDITANPDLRQQPGYNLIASFNDDENMVFYMTQLHCGTTKTKSVNLERVANSSTVVI